jgi:ribosome recycling factor
MNFEEQVLSELRAIRKTLNDMIKNKDDQPMLSEDDKRQLDLFYGEVEENKKFKPENGFYNGRTGVWYGN